jgi:metallophosphoesterase (TIGR00282 family)
MIGDVIGKPGREAVRRLVPELRGEKRLDLVVANGENAAGGYGLTVDTAWELLDSGVDVLTSGNHIWDKKEFIPYLDDVQGSGLPVVRPANYPDAPGMGYIRRRGVTVLNLMGRVFMDNLDCPFRTADRILAEIQEEEDSRVIIVDFHAEATSEKQAMGWYLDGRVSGVFGTHTHVGTVDARILPGGTAYLTDVGMTGPTDSVIGSDKASVLERFLTSMPNRLPVAGGPCAMNSVLVEVDDATGAALTVERIDRKVE